jgi:hypothetical protein
MRLNTLITPCLFWISLNTSAAPRFDDYASSHYEGRVRKVLIRDGRSREFATLLRANEGRRANFAGHIVLASWGCGASCVMGAAIDARTGDVHWLPFTVSNWSSDVTQPLEFRRDSRLLVVHGSRDDHGTGDETRC